MSQETYRLHQAASSFDLCITHSSTEGSEAEEDGEAALFMYELYCEIFKLKMEMY